MQRKQQAQKLLGLIEALDLDAGLRDCLEHRALRAKDAEEWREIKLMDDLREQFLVLVNVIASKGQLEYKNAGRNRKPIGEPRE